MALAARRVFAWASCTALVVACEGQIELAKNHAMAGFPGRDGAVFVPGVADKNGHIAPAIGGYLCSPSAGTVPFTTTCTFQVTDTAGNLRCSLDLDADGTLEVELPSCSGAQTAPISVTKVGSHAVLLTVTDAEGAQTKATVPVAAEPPPNRAPTLDGVTAAPSMGSIPFSSVLAWKVEDPDGDALSCSIDVGGDGTVEHALSPCTSELTQSVELPVAGTYPVVVKVQDAQGLSAEKTVTLTARTPNGDLTLARVEWGQTIISETPRLVAGKDALLRLHVLSQNAGISEVKVKAEGRRAGAVLGNVALTGPDAVPQTEAPDDLSQQYSGLVPGEWIQDGLEVHVTVDDGDVVPELDEKNNERVLRPEIGVGNVLELTVVPITADGVASRDLDVSPSLVAYWPLQRVSRITRAPYTTQTVLSQSGSGWSQMLSELRSVRSADGSPRYYYGLARLSYTGGTLGIGYTTTTVALGTDVALRTAVHEVGHNFGRKHAPCGGVDNVDSSFPYANARLGTWGWNPLTGKLMSPTSSYDVMSYCTPAWVSDYTYRAVQQRLEESPPPSMLIATTSPDSGGSEDSTRALQEVFLVSGRITPTETVLDPIQRIRSHRSAREDGDCEVTLTLDGRPVTVKVSTSLEAHSAQERHFTALVPVTGELSSVEVSQHGKRLLRRDRDRFLRRDASAPRLREEDGRLEVRWNAARYPFAAVAHLGQERTTLALRLAGGVATVSLERLPSGGAFEVSLSDGMDAVRSEIPRAALAPQPREKE